MHSKCYSPYVKLKTQNLQKTVILDPISLMTVSISAGNSTHTVLIAFVQARYGSSLMNFVEPFLFKFNLVQNTLITFPSHTTKTHLCA